MSPQVYNTDAFDEVLNTSPRRGGHALRSNLTLLFERCADNILSDGISVTLTGVRTERVSYFVLPPRCVIARVPDDEYGI